MFCSKCGAKNAADAAFCQKCGISLKANANTEGTIRYASFLWLVVLPALLTYLTLRGENTSLVAVGFLVILVVAIYTFYRYFRRYGTNEASIILKVSIAAGLINGIAYNLIEFFAYSQHFVFDLVIPTIGLFLLFFVTGAIGYALAQRETSNNHAH